MSKCYHYKCNREVEFELTGRWECNYHMGLDFEGDDMHPIRPIKPMAEEPNLPKPTKEEQRLLNRIRELEGQIAHLKKEPGRVS